MNYAHIVSDNGLSSVGNRAINWTNAYICRISHCRKCFWKCLLTVVSQIAAASVCLEVICILGGQPSVRHPFGPSQVTYKVMLKFMHCHHIIGLEISAKALVLLSQIPPKCTRSCCMSFHISRSALSCNMYTYMYINKITKLSLYRQTNIALLCMAALLAAVTDTTVDYGTIFIQRKSYNARRETLHTVVCLSANLAEVNWLHLVEICEA